MYTSEHRIIIIMRSRRRRMLFVHHQVSRPHANTVLTRHMLVILGDILKQLVVLFLAVRLILHIVASMQFHKHIIRQRWRWLIWLLVLDSDIEIVVLQQRVDFRRLLLVVLRLLIVALLLFDHLVPIHRLLGMAHFAFLQQIEILKRALLTFPLLLRVQVVGAFASIGSVPHLVVVGNIVILYMQLIVLIDRLQRQRVGAVDAHLKHRNLVAQAQPFMDLQLQ
mmetsp:Transcript_12990/g.20640  ORF Transcript_12990/g.20640 Transcript_12990/m.20640 type:complete len:223 (-) Transcript_12990:969-1637(-)